MKSTKRSLALSALSLMLCISMLLGTTFAWFTDSVTSGKNKIVAGNLDIELEYYNGSEWKPVTEETKLFDDEALWEPGHTEVAYLKLSNVGTLALKYKLAINVYKEVEGINVDGDVFKLSDYIYMGIVEGNEEKFFADRDEARAAVSEAGLIKAYSESGNMVAGADSEYIAIVIFMPETVENDANYKLGTEAPYIEMGIEVVATQLVNENDSFGPDYDEDADLEDPVVIPETIVAEKIENEGNLLKEAVVLKNSDGSIIAEVPEGAKLVDGTTELKLVVKPSAKAPAGVTVEVDPLSQIAVYYDIEIEGLADDNDKAVTVKIFVGKDYKDEYVKVYHINDEIVSAVYDETTGIVTFESATFSPFTIIVGDGIYRIDTVDDLLLFAGNVNGSNTYAGKTVLLLEDLDLAGIEWTPIGNVASYPGTTFSGEFNGQGHVISNLTTSDNTANHAAAGFFGSAKNATIENLTLKNVDVTSSHYAGSFVAYHSEGEVSIKNCHVDGGVVKSVPELVGENEYDNGDKVGGILGYGVAGATVKNCSVKNLTVIAHRDMGGIVGATSGTVTDNTVEDCSIIQSNENGYKTSIDTYHAIVGRTLEGLTESGNTAKNVKVYTNLADGVEYYHDDNEYAISSAEGMVWFANTVNGGNNFKDKTVKLAADIDLAGIEWTPIGRGNRFQGTFDGQNHTISNLTSVLDSTSTTQYGNGLFGDITGGAVLKNFVVENANVYDAVEGKGNVYGIVCGYAYGTVTFENITVKNSKVSAFGKVGAILGMAADAGGTTTIKNCKVENVEIIGAYNCATFAGLTQNVVVIKGNTQSDVTFKYSSRYPASAYTDVDDTAASVNGHYWKYTDEMYYAAWSELYNEQKTTTINGGAITIDAITHNIKKIVVEKGDTKDATQTNVNAAIAAAQVNDVVVLPNTDEGVKLPAIPEGVTIKGDGTTKINAVGSGSVASVPSGATFEGVVVDYGKQNYHGFQHAGAITFKNSTLNDLFFSYGDMTFENCIFNAPEGEYSMWLYAGNITFKNCVFNGSGKWFNVYNESNDGGTPWNVKFEDCKFVNLGSANKAAINVKDTCGNKKLMYNVEINNCTTEGLFPEKYTSDTKIVIDSLVMVDDIKDGDNYINIKLDGELVYPVK